jgi:hypothetical protein
VPKQYEVIRDALLEKGMSTEKAKEHAARIYISKGKGKAGRSKNAKALKHG